MRYRFLGQPDEIFPDLVHGKIYDLEIKVASKGIFGWLVGNIYPVILEPIQCPYGSWEAFYKNWEPLTLRTMKLDSLLTKKHEKVKMKVEAK